MPNDAGTSIGVYIGPDDQQLLDEFDQLPGTRSANLRRAMALLVAAENGMDAVGEDLRDWDERALKATTKQAMIDHFRE